MNIILLPDLLRETRVFPEGFFDLVREPILQGCGIRIGFPPGGKRPHGLSSGFDVATFRDLVAEKDSWACSYYKIPERARNYLLEYLPVCDLILSFEMPPWLIDLCVQENIPFLDMRVSPLRFGRDLYVALRTSEPSIYRRISALVVSVEELRLEASQLAASVRLQKMRLEEERRYDFSLGDCLIFIGQAPYDASLLSPDTSSQSCWDYVEKIREIAQGRPLLHKSHPFATEFSRAEREALATITGQPVLPCNQNAYQILSSDEDVQLLGISSSLLQEAVWFEKVAHTLYRPFVPLATADIVELNHYQQIHHHIAISPFFWHQILTPERTPPAISRLTALPHNNARETLDQWWDYSKVLTWERSLPYEGFVRSGGLQLSQRVDVLEKTVGRGTPVGISGGNSLETLQKELVFSLYSRLASGYSRVDEVFFKNLSPAAYKNKILDAQYYQKLHEDNTLFQTNNWLLPYVNFIREKQFDQVREVGCGNGAFVAEIAKSVRRVVGLDWARSPNFPQGNNIEFCQQDLTSAELEVFDLNCSADVLEHIETTKLPLLIKSLHASARFNFHVIACYDDGHSHLSILPPDAWLFLFRRESMNYKLMDFSIRHDDIEHVVCVVTNV